MAKGKLKTDSPVSRRIVLSFLDFLDSVEPAPGVNVEGLEIVKECLTEAFKLESSSPNDQRKPDASLVEIFSSMEGVKHRDQQLCCSSEAGSSDAPSSSSAQKSVDLSLEASKPSLDQGDDRTRVSFPLGVSKDELCGQFFDALEKINFFKSNDGNDDETQIDTATRLFHEAISDMERSGCRTYNSSNLADSLKSLGNKSMQSKLYKDAIELYSCAIGLCENNAVYYCNRAAAFTQIHEYSKAIRDCHKSIEIDPNYSKAYSRLGLAYYAQGNYRDAINKGFRRALQLDPNNESVKENIRVAAEKYQEALLRAHGQHPGSASHNQQADNQSTGGSWNHANPPPFTSIPFSTAGFPDNFANMFMNMAANTHQGTHAEQRPEEGSDVNGSGIPEMNIGGNINVNLGEGMPGNINVNLGEGVPGNFNVSLGEIPQEFSGALRSVMQMFSGAAPQANPPDNSSGSAPI